jgi:hypothetical protein
MAPSQSKLVERALKEHFLKKKKAVAASEQDSTAFSIRSKNHNLSITTNHVFLWKTKHAIRELVTNCIDGCVEMANEIGHGGEVVWKVHAGDVGNVGNVAPAPGAKAIPMKTEWRATATLCDVVIAEIHFTRSTESQKLYAFVTNHFTCLHVLKIFGFGFSTKIGDATQSGKFGDGLKSATVALVRPRSERRWKDRNTRATMSLQTNGRRWKFTFDTRDKPAWLSATKESKKASGEVFNADEKRDTIIKLVFFDTSFELKDIFDENMYMVFSPGVETIPLGDGAALIDGEAFKNTVYVTGVRVCKSESFVRGVGYTDDEMLRKHMTRDRSVISNDSIWDSFVTRVKAFLEQGGSVDRIYELTAAVSDNDWTCAFNRLARDRSGDNGTWPDAFAARFKEIHGGDAFPYNEIEHRGLIEADLHKTPIRVGHCLYEILCRSKSFAPVSEAVADEFVFAGANVDWPEESNTHRCADVVVKEVLERAGMDAEHQLMLRDTTCKRNVIVKKAPAGHFTNVYLKSSLVKKVDVHKDPIPIRVLMHELMHALQDFIPTHLEREDIAYLYSRISDISRGLFDEKYEVEADGSEGISSDAGPDVGEVVEAYDDDSSSSDEERDGPASRKRPVPDDSGDDADSDMPPVKRANTNSARNFGDIPDPVPSSVPNATIPAESPRSSAAATAAVIDHPTSTMDHELIGELTLLEEFTDDRHGAVFYKSSKWELTRDAEYFYVTAAEGVRKLLRDVFGWDDSVKFGVYVEDSTTHAFTRNSQLFVNAFNAREGSRTTDLVWYYFSTLCHEMTHILGYVNHDASFATAVSKVTAKYQPKLISHLMTKHVNGNCDVNCLVKKKHLCSKHRGFADE